MEAETPWGTEREIAGRLRVYYDGYWIKAYRAPADTLRAKKELIEALTRRLFNHVEYGLNVPGTRLEEARAAFMAETCPQRKRVLGAMLAGAVFNRATDIFTKLVEIQSLGVTIEADNPLMRQCGKHLQEALALGKMVLHRSGEEGIDELWGEPFKAFAFPIEEFYKSRYIKIAHTLRSIDDLRDALLTTFAASRAFDGIETAIRDFAEAAKIKSETLRTEADIFDVWTTFVVAAEKLTAFRPTSSNKAGRAEQQLASDGLQLIHDGKDLISYIARARVQMPSSTANFIDRCAAYRASLLSRAASARGSSAPAPPPAMNSPR
jgi:hypothetical protein